MEGEVAVSSCDLIASPELQTQLRRCSKTIVHAKGTAIFRRGDEVEGVFLICRGKVSLGLEPDNELYPRRTLGPGAIIGLPATVAGGPYSLTAEVLEEAELAFVDRQTVLDCLRLHPDLCMQVMDLLGNEICGIRSALKLVDVGRPGRTAG